MTFSELSPRAKAVAKRRFEEDHLAFTRGMFSERRGDPFLIGPHHRVLSRVVDDVLAGRRKRVIINVPPGYTKTETCVISLIAHGLALNPRSRYIHASFNGELVNENSTAIRDTIATPAYREMWGISIRDDTSAKGLWRTEQGGGLLAKPAGGPITGFRAGLMVPGFSGVFVIDDPLKPDDANSKAERDNVNNRWHSTFKSRLAHEGVPVVVIMQRLHPEDFCGFLLKGGSGEVWDHLLLPVCVNNALKYPDEWTHGRPIEHGLPDGPLWVEKHTAKQIEILKVDAFTYAAQYDQRPIAAGGALFKEAHFERRWHELPAMHHRAIYGDTAQKTATRNDYTVFQCWGAGVDGRAVLIDQVREKVEAPELEPLARAFWQKHTDTRLYPTHIYGTCRELNIEDKVSGTGLIQGLRRAMIPVNAIPRSKDKLTRAQDALPWLAVGGVVFPGDAPWFTDYKAELLGFDGLGGGFDDQVDPTLDAISQLCAGAVPFETWV